MASASIASIAPVPLPVPYGSSSPSASSRGSPHRRNQSSRNSNSRPTLPVFSFNPGADAAVKIEAERSPSPVHPILEAMAPAQEPRKSRPPPLPAFTFNPGADLELEPSPSPTHPILEEMARRSAKAPTLADLTLGPRIGDSQPSPSPTRSSFGDASYGSRGGGHRRRGSEFVGGGSDGTHLTSPTMVSTSPSKTDDASRLSGPPVAGSTPGRYNHKHKRSQAVSISEIETSDLIKANAIAKHQAQTASGPSTPSDAGSNHHFPASPSAGPSQSISGSPGYTAPPSPRRARRESAPGFRPRVGFSDTVDVIPRPLSLISSETEGSNSTIRGTHSLTGSINSFGAVSPPAQIPSHTVTEKVDHSPRERPKTADAASPTPERFRSEIQSGDEGQTSPRPASASGLVGQSTSSGSPPNKKRHFWFSPSIDGSPKSTPQTEKPDPLATLQTFIPAAPSEIVRPKTSPERQASIKKRQGRTWTGHLFSRKGKGAITKAKPRANPTPPSLTRRPSDRLNEIFDADDTVVIREPPPLVKASAPSLTVAQPPPPPPPSSDSVYEYEEHVTSPVVDLDAALGPCGSEEKLAGAESAPRNAAARISRLHSSERRGTLDAFGATHRRAESAPQMPPVNRSIFAVHRLGSNTSVEDDVFDEEEEDDFLANEKEPSETAVSDSSPETTSAFTSSVVSEVAPMPVIESIKPADAVDPIKNAGLGLTGAPSALDRVAIVEPEEVVASDGRRSSNSTMTTPVLTEADLPKRPASSPMEFLYGPPQTSYASSVEGRTATNSMISSPDVDHIAFDTQPRFTRYLGEQNLDVVVRGSNDDLPSLTDSVSTGAVPRFSSSAGTRSSTENRAAAFFAPPQPKPNQAWKRASLASLNRLIPGSANGSKLRIEESAGAENDGKQKKSSNRISRLMHFWRSKEKASA